MANIYKLKRKDNGALSKKNYTLGGARAARKRLENINIETKVIKYKENVVVIDQMASITGEIGYYAKPTQAQYKQMTKKKG